MPRLALLAALLLPLSAADYSGAAALEHTRKIVSFGPRHPGSEASRNARAWIAAQLQPLGCTVAEDAFVARTPRGQVRMANLVARFAGKGGRALAVTGHYDTKHIAGVNFLGANDGGASAGFLVEMARALKGRALQHDVYLVWFDGEEAYGQWSSTDSLYGSRHLAEKWAADGTLRRLDALINVDMIGDRDLQILNEMYSSETLRNVVWQSAAALGHSRHFLRSGGAIEDDHMPFLKRGVSSLDLIDFDYGPNNAWWHTAADTMDKLSANSLQVVGQVMLETLRRLDN
jgi:Zn-dependent M28 family amino/carboxypeptidase